MECVTDDAASLPRDLAQRIADRVGEAFGSKPGTTWVRLRELPGHRYAENGAGDDSGPRPVFVTVLKARHEDPDRLRDEAARLTTVIAKECGRPPDRVHVLFEPEASGRIAFGGRMLAAAVFLLAALAVSAPAIATALT